MITKTQLTKEQELALLYLAISSEAFDGIGAGSYFILERPCCAVGHLMLINETDTNLFISAISRLFDVGIVIKNDSVVRATGKGRISFKEWCEGMGIEDSIYSIKE